MRVLVCFDGSAASRAALAAVRQLTQDTQSEVHLVRVTYHDLSTGGVPWSGSQSVDIEKHGSAVVEDAETGAEMEAVAREMSVPVQVAVLNGRDVADELIRCARAQQVDLIAVGCRQRGPLHRGVGGEVTVRLTESRVAPVLLGRMTLSAPSGWRTSRSARRSSRTTGSSSVSSRRSARRRWTSAGETGATSWYRSTMRLNCP